MILAPSAMGLLRPDWKESNRALGGGLAERGIVGAPELADHPRQFEMEQRDTPAPEIRPPIWIELCLTIEELGAELYEWVSTAGPDANPPAIINITALINITSGGKAPMTPS